MEILADEEGESDWDEFEGNWSEDRGSRQRNCFLSKEVRTIVQVGQEEEEEKVEADADLWTCCAVVGERKVEDVGRLRVSGRLSIRPREESSGGCAHARKRVDRQSCGEGKEVLVSARVEEEVEGVRCCAELNVEEGQSGPSAVEVRPDQTRDPPVAAKRRRIRGKQRSNAPHELVAAKLCNEVGSCARQGFTEDRAMMKSTSRAMSEEKQKDGAKRRLAHAEGEEEERSIVVRPVLRRKISVSTAVEPPKLRDSGVKRKRCQGKQKPMLPQGAWRAEKDEVTDSPSTSVPLLGGASIADEEIGGHRRRRKRSPQHAVT